jgi:monoamine oxidase
MAKNFIQNIKFGEVVNSIVQKEDKCHINTSKATYQAKKIIIAIPPILASKIDYDPLLNINKRQLLQKIPMGIVVKCYAIYKKPFWRDKGYSGEAVTDENSPYQTIFDNGPAHSDYGVLMGFAIADRANILMQHSVDERKDLMIKTLVRYFGSEAVEIQHYEDKCWADEEFSQGCYAGYLPPGIWTKYKDALRQVEGHIHWAGTETATVWNGYIEGAVRSGLRAAQEIKDAL